MGLAIGRWGGRRWGRSVGESFGATVHEILASGPENRSFREVVSDAREGAVSRISGRAEEGRERIAEGEERIKEEAAKVTDELSAIENIDRETLDDLTDRELESVAQEAGVKADQAREEMTTKILDATPGYEAEEDDNTPGEPGDVS